MQKVNEEDFHKVFDTQIIFRMLEDSVARPGKINNIATVCKKINTPPSFSSGLTGIIFTLIDAETNFSVLAEQQQEIEEYIKWNTMSKSIDIEKADYLFVDKHLSEEEIKRFMSSVKRGTLLNPHQSATIVLSVKKISAEKIDNNGLELHLKGPGIETTNICYLSGVSEVWIEEREKTNAEYPLGVDMFLVSEDGDLLCLSRTTVIERR